MIQRKLPRTEEEPFQSLCFTMFNSGRKLIVNENVLVQAGHFLFGWSRYVFTKLNCSAPISQIFMKQKPINSRWSTLQKVFWAQLDPVTRWVAKSRKPHVPIRGRSVTVSRLVDLQSNASSNHRRLKKWVVQLFKRHRLVQVSSTQVQNCETWPLQTAINLIHFEFRRQFYVTYTDFGHLSAKRCTVLVIAHFRRNK